MRRKYGDKLRLFCLGEVLKRVDHRERAFALSDVRPKVFALYLGISYQVEKIVLQLEGKAYLEAKIFECVKRLLVSATNKCAQYQGICSRVVGSLGERHKEVLLRGNIPALVLSPTKIKRLALKGVLLHGEKGVDNANFKLVREVVGNGNASDNIDQGRIANVDGKPGTKCLVEALLATA